jgi:hypothetical protein
MSPDVFICHSSKDKNAVNMVLTAIESSGYSCWIAPRDIRPGRMYPEEIVEAINIQPRTAGSAETADRRAQALEPPARGRAACGGRFSFAVVVRFRHVFERLLCDAGARRPVLRRPPVPARRIGPPLNRRQNFPRHRPYLILTFDRSGRIIPVDCL